MNSKQLLLLLFVFVVQARAAEFRFVHAEGVTGLANVVYSENGKATTIIITKDSNSEALAILDALLSKQIYGTKGVEDHEGAKWEQAIVLVGEFVPKAGRTEKIPKGVPLPEWSFLRVTSIKVLFPVSRFEVAAGGNPIDGPMIVETHFGFDSLFPKGVVLGKKPIDLSKHTAKRRSSQ